MSAETGNVEIVRATIDSLNRRDLDRAVEAAHEDFEADWSNSIAPHRGVYRGRERARELFEAFLEAWEEFQLGARRSSSRLTRRGCSSSTGSGGAVGAAASKWTPAALSCGRSPAARSRSVKLYQSKAEALEAVRAVGSDLP